MPRAIRLVAPIVIALSRRIQKTSVEGAERIPAVGPLIVAANHTCHLDAITMGVLVYKAGRVPRFAARADLFKLPVLGWFLRRADQVPIYRRDAISAPKDGGTPASSFSEMSAAVGRGKTMIIFPESTFTRDPERWPMKARTGVARLALAHPDAVVIPVAHWGNEGIINPYGGKVSWRNIGRKRTSLAVRVGEPVGLERFRGRPVTAELLADATEAVMEAITSELAVLRSGDVGAGKGPRERRWDKEIDGDPYQEVMEAGQRNIAARLDRRAERIDVRIRLLIARVFRRVRGRRR